MLKLFLLLLFPAGAIFLSFLIVLLVINFKSCTSLLKRTVSFCLYNLGSIISHLIKSNTKFFKYEFSLLRVLSLLLLLSILYFPLSLIFKLITTYNFDYNKLNEIGGTFSFLNPIVGIFAALITYCAFYVQYRANKHIIDDNKKQKVISRFFELLETHKQNVAELKTDEFIYEYEEVFKNNEWQKIRRVKKNTQDNGRGVFSRYLNTITDLLNWYNLFLAKRKTKQSPLERIIFVYNFFFTGDSDKEKQLFKSFIEQNFHILARVETFSDPDYAPNISKSLLSEHKTELNHYYRHLYMMVKYVDQVDEDTLSYSEKRDLLRILRAQLTNKEQIMLFYNWLSGHGSQWEKMRNNNVCNSFFLKYRMIHNISLEDLVFIPHISYEGMARYFIRLIKMICEKKNLPGGRNFQSEKEWDPVFQFEDILNK